MRSQKQCIFLSFCHRFSQSVPRLSNQRTHQRTLSTQAYARRGQDPVSMATVWEKGGASERTNALMPACMYACIHWQEYVWDDGSALHFTLCFFFIFELPPSIPPDVTFPPLSLLRHTFSLLSTETIPTRPLSLWRSFLLVPTHSGIGFHRCWLEWDSKASYLTCK